MLTNPIISYQDLINADPGQDMGTLPRNIARAAKDAVCSLYNDYPEWMTNGRDAAAGLLGAPTLAELCQRNGRNNTTDQFLPVRGGQCPGVQYQARVRFYGVTLSNTRFDTGWGPWSSPLPGPILEVFTRESVTVTVNGNQYGRTLFVRPTGQGPFNVGSTGGRKSITAQEYEIRRVDLQPDTCGSPPPPPVPVPPVSDVFKPVPIPTPNGPIVIPVVIPLKVFVFPRFQVNVGDINVNIDFGGVTFAPKFDVNLTTNRPTEPQPVGPILPPLPPGRPEPDDPDAEPRVPPCPAVNLGPVLDGIEQIKSYTRRPKTRLKNEFLGQFGSLDQTIPARTRFVIISVVTPPPNIRTQFGGDNGPDVFYQGWVSVGRGRKYGERVSLSYAENAIVIPEGHDSISFTLYEGGLAAVSLLVEEDESECVTYECG